MPADAAFHRTLVLAWLALALPISLVLLRIRAPYGRHARPGFGPGMPARIAWMVMESPAVVGMILLYAAARPPGAAPAALLGLWLLHYLNRALVYPLRLGPTATAMPAAIVASGFAFNAVNAYLQGRWSFAIAPPADPWLGDPRFVAGAALFLAGLATNLHADAVLRRLRGTGSYQIPRGGLYRWVSCPNYLGEIVEWIGWAIAAWSLAGLSFAVWTAANLVPRALAHHRWYRERFPDYPRERRAVVPGVL